MVSYISDSRTYPYNCYNTPYTALLASDASIAIIAHAPISLDLPTFPTPRTQPVRLVLVYCKSIS